MSCYYSRCLYWEFIVYHCIYNDSGEHTFTEVDREVTIYLTNLHIVQKTINDIHKTGIDEINAYWLKKYNFLSLLNIPETIDKYGPLINLWEGSNQGEGYLRYAKPKVTDIHSKNWQINAHINLLNETSLNNVINCHALNKTSDNIKDEYKKNTTTKLRTSKKCFNPTSQSMKYTHCTDKIDLYR